MNKNLKLLSIVILLCYLISSSCTKISQPPYKPEIYELAYSTLNSKMSTVDFETIDWTSYSIKNQKNNPDIIFLRSKTNKNKVLIFSMKNKNNLKYNWIEFKTNINKYGTLDGKVILSGVDNSILKDIIIQNNKAYDKKAFQQESKVAESKNFKFEFGNTPVELPEVVVTSYRTNKPNVYWSIYWLLNFDISYYNLYTDNASLFNISQSNTEGDSNELLNSDELSNYWDDPNYELGDLPYNPANDGPRDADGFRKNGGVYKYLDGEVQNYTNDNGGKYAVFTNSKGEKVVFPGATITNFGIKDKAGVTTANGGIHLSLVNGSLEDMQHEYGHYLQAKALGSSSLYYLTIAMPSLYSAFSNPSGHRLFWTEINANKLASEFFGPDSDIAKSIYYPHE